jgi:putative membrane protein
MTEPAGERRWPARVYGHGSEPDPRFSLANERTFLAWIRTTLALLAGAAAVHAFDLDVSDLVARTASTLLAASAFGCALNAWVGWARTESALRDGRPLPSNGVGVALVAVVAAAALIMLAIGARG